MSCCVLAVFPSSSRHHCNHIPSLKSLWMMWGEDMGWNQPPASAAPAAPSAEAEATKSLRHPSTGFLLNTSISTGWSDAPVFSLSLDFPNLPPAHSLPSKLGQMAPTLFAHIPQLTCHKVSSYRAFSQTPLLHFKAELILSICASDFKCRWKPAETERSAHAYTLCWADVHSRGFTDEGGWSLLWKDAAVNRANNGGNYP